MKKEKEKEKEKSSETTGGPKSRDGYRTHTANETERLAVDVDVDVDVSYTVSQVKCCAVLCCAAAQVLPVTGYLYLDVRMVFAGGLALVTTFGFLA